MAGLKTHDIFFKKTKELLPNEILKKYPNYDKFNVFAQGHDLFLYNNFYKIWRNRKINFHSKICFDMQDGNFPEFVFNYIRCAQKLNVAEDESIRAFLSLGFVSHHILDSYTHPFIIYMSGDHAPIKRNNTWMHGNIETLIDMHYMLIEEHRTSPEKKFRNDFKFKYNKISNELYTVLDHSIFLTYNYANQGKTLKNSFKYVKKYAKFLKEDKSGRKHKLFKYLDNKFPGAMSFSYNRDAYEVQKYLNKDKKTWKNPIVDGIYSNESFEELFNKSLRKVVGIITELESLYTKKDLTREDVYNIIPDVSSVHGQKPTYENKIIHKSIYSSSKKSLEKEIIKKIVGGEKKNKKIYKHIHSTNSDNFTNKIKMDLRKFFHPLVRFVLKFSLEKENIVLRRPKLDKKKAYIFVPTHSFDEDLKTTVATIDRNAYLVLGLTEQIRYNPDMIFAYLGTGMIHLFKDNKHSRKECYKKMIKVLNNKNSLIIYPEGAYNHSQNLIMLDLYDSIFYAAKETGAQIVPIASYSRYDYDKIYTVIGDPIDTADIELNDKKIFMSNLRDNLATMMWNLWEDFAPKVSRKDLGSVDKFYYERMHEYLGVLWDPRNNDWINEEVNSKNEFEKENTNNFRKYLYKHWKEAQEDIFFNKKMNKRNKK